MLYIAMQASVGKAAWGDVPAWISAIGSLLALAFAAVAAYTAHKLYKIESGRDETSEKDRQKRHEETRQQQAARVCTWYKGKHVSHDETEWYALVRNASDLPIYDVTVNFYLKTTQNTGASLRRGEQSAEFIPPGDVTVPAPEVMLRQVDKESAAAFRAGLTFRDASGNKWIRDEFGKLRPLSDTDQPY